MIGSVGLNSGAAMFTVAIGVGCAGRRGDKEVKQREDKEVEQIIENYFLDPTVTPEVFIAQVKDRNQEVVIRKLSVYLCDISLSSQRQENRINGLFGIGFIDSPEDENYIRNLLFRASLATPPDQQAKLMRYFVLDPFMGATWLSMWFDHIEGNISNVDQAVSVFYKVEYSEQFNSVFFPLLVDRYAMTISSKDENEIRNYARLVTKLRGKPEFIKGVTDRYVHRGDLLNSPLHLEVLKRMGRPIVHELVIRLLLLNDKCMQGSEEAAKYLIAMGGTDPFAATELMREGERFAEIGVCDEGRRYRKNNWRIPRIIGKMINKMFAEGSSPAGFWERVKEYKPEERYKILKYIGENKYIDRDLREALLFQFLKAKDEGQVMNALVYLYPIELPSSCRHTGGLCPFSPQLLVIPFSRQEILDEIFSKYDFDAFAEKVQRIWTSNDSVYALAVARALALSDKRESYFWNIMINTPFGNDIDSEIVASYRWAEVEGFIDQVLAGDAPPEFGTYDMFLKFVVFAYLRDPEPQRHSETKRDKVLACMQYLYSEHEAKIPMELELVFALVCGGIGFDQADEEYANSIIYNKFDYELRLALLGYRCDCNKETSLRHIKKKIKKAGESKKSWSGDKSEQVRLIEFVGKWKMVETEEALKDVLGIGLFDLRDNDEDATEAALESLRMLQAGN